MFQTGSYQITDIHVTHELSFVFNSLCIKEILYYMLPKEIIHPVQYVL